MTNHNRKAIAVAPASEVGTTTIVDIAKRAAAEGTGVNKRALRALHVKVVGEQTVEKRFMPGDQPAEPGKSNALTDDPFAHLADEGKIIAPPFDMLTLAMLPETSSELGPCIEAMTTNIDGFGHRQICRIRLDGSAEVPEAMRSKVMEERCSLTNFFEYATEESFTEFRMRLRRDLETTGNGYWEVIRDAKGQIQQFKHIPSYQMRLSRSDDKPVEVMRKILRLQPDGSVKLEEVKEWRRFRRYVQGRSITRRTGHQSIQGHHRWFKAFGDPRVWKASDGTEGNDATPAADRATEVVHLTLYSGRSPYGLPRFIGNLLSIYGDRAAEEINYTTFRNNNIPSMMIMVSNGQLTEGSIQRLESFVESQIQGSDNYSKFIIVEGETTADEGEDAGQVKIQVEKLANQQHQDALFQNYSKNNQDKIRRAFRLPPILVGRADDYTRATADASKSLADEQVFAPARDVFDAFINRWVYPDMGVLYHKFKSNTPNTTDNESIVGILAGSEKTGGMTPRIARSMLEQVLGTELPDFPPDFPADVPFSLTMAEAVKNQADPAEPGQQVTALKAFLGDGVDDATIQALQGDPTMAHLAEVWAATDKAWRRAARTAEPAPDPDQDTP
jgi:PBSX family phage portal protein